MKQSEVANKLQELAESITGINETVYDWITAINKGNNNYDLCLIVPFKKSQEQPREMNYKNYDVVAYFFTPLGNSNASEKSLLWDKTDSYATKFVKEINKLTGGEMVISGKINYDVDDTGIGKDVLVWTKITFTLRVFNCDE